MRQKYILISWGGKKNWQNLWSTKSELHRHHNFQIYHPLHLFLQNKVWFYSLELDFIDDDILALVLFCFSLPFHIQELLV